MFAYLQALSDSSVPINTLAPSSATEERVADASSALEPTAPVRPDPKKLVKKKGRWRATGFIVVGVTAAVVATTTLVAIVILDCKRRSADTKLRHGNTLVRFR
jgi:hypothetical protein